MKYWHFHVPLHQVVQPHSLPLMHTIALATCIKPVPDHQWGSWPLPRPALPPSQQACLVVTVSRYILTSMCWWLAVLQRWDLLWLGRTMYNVYMFLFLPGISLPGHGKMLRTVLKYILKITGCILNKYQIDCKNFLWITIKPNFMFSGKILLVFLSTLAASCRKAIC